MSDTQPTVQEPAAAPVVEQAAETAVATLEAAPAQEGVGIELLTVAAPTTDWRSWVAQQGGIQPTTVLPPPFPPSTSGGTPGTVFPGIGPISDLIKGATSTPVYDDTPTYRKPPDIYQGWTAQVPNAMVPGVFPPAAVLISRANPRTGPSAGGTATVITGTGFTGATAVNFGATPGTAFTVVNDQTITVTTPAGSANSTVAITVVNATKGNQTLPNAFNYGA